MFNAVRTMLDLQDRMNTKVHPEWRQQGFEWYRAAWIECAELMDHAGYKWWKHADPDMEQIQLEVVDIWHFGMSSMICQCENLDDLADQIAKDLQGAKLYRIRLVETHSIHTDYYGPDKK